MATRYAVVSTAGRHIAGELVLAHSVSADREKALATAARLTRDWRQIMRRYGGASGGYRVVETTARTARTARWRAVDVDALPSVR